MTAQPRFLFVGTHHKTGTVWMRRTFHRFATANDIPVVRVSGRTTYDDLPAKGPALLVNWGSDLSTDLLDHKDVRAFHVIRDPRDVLISGARYHLTAKTGNEKWITRTNPAWGGMNYQEKINSLTNPLDQLRFEMHGKHKTSLLEMLRWPYGHAHAADVRFEDLIVDEDTSLFKSAIRGLNVAGFDPDGVTQAYWDQALFGGQKENRTGLVANHVKSGKAAQWKSRLPLEIAVEYNTAFGADLITLGYAENSDWVDECQPFAALQAASSA